MFWIVAAVLVIVLLAAALPLLFVVDDWSRDLTTNHAATSETAANEMLRPLTSRLSADELAALVESVVDDLPNWENVDKSQRNDNGAIICSLVRSTKIMRYQDDVTVTIVAKAAGGSRLSAESRSRVGKGDLGQNPRNLIELLGAIRNRLDERDLPAGD